MSQLKSIFQAVNLNLRYPFFPPVTKNTKNPQKSMGPTGFLGKIGKWRENIRMARG